MAGEILHVLRLQGNIAFSNKEWENRRYPEGVGWGVMNKTNHPKLTQPQLLFNFTKGATLSFTHFVYEKFFYKNNQ